MISAAALCALFDFHAEGTAMPEKIVSMGDAGVKGLTVAEVQAESWLGEQRARVMATVEERNRYYGEVEGMEDLLFAKQQEFEKAATHAYNLNGFKQYVHDRLDKAGVPADPEPEANAIHGCRIEGRINWLLAKLAATSLSLHQATE